MTNRGTPPPSWEIFEKCPRCGVNAGAACVSMRGVPKGYYPNRRRTMMLSAPHRGRRQVGQRAQPNA